MKTFLTALALTATHALAVPPTLLEISGRQWPAASLSNSVLVIVDAQCDYATRLRLPGIDEATSSIARLLAKARASGTPACHVVQHNPGNSRIFAENSPGAEILPALTPVHGETVVIKHLPNSFAETSLATKVAATGRKNLIIVGFMTHMCVSSTVRAALDLGYRCTVVDSCCATRDLPDGKGGIVTAAEIHRAELAALRDRFACVVSTPEDIGDH